MGEKGGGGWVWWRKGLGEQRLTEPSLIDIMTGERSTNRARPHTQRTATSVPQSMRTVDNLQPSRQAVVEFSP